MDLVPVRAFTHSPEAHLARNLLESEGIPAFLSEEVAGDMLHLTNEVKLLVAGENAGRAREILAAADRHEFTGEAAAEAEEHSTDAADE